MKQTAYVLKMAGAAALAGSSQAYGQYITLTPQPTGTLPANVPGVLGAEPREYYDFATGVTSSVQLPGDDFRFEAYNNGDGSYFFTGALGLKAGNALVIDSTGYAKALTLGEKISASTQTFSTNAFVAENYYGTPLGQPLNTPTYLGFEFTDASNKVHNGWFEIENETYTSPSSPGGLIFLGGAYNSRTGAILAGEVPEPSTLSALILGAAALSGVGLARRRRAGLAAQQN